MHKKTLSGPSQQRLPFTANGIWESLPEAKRRRCRHLLTRLYVAIALKERREHDSNQ